MRCVVFSGPGGPEVVSVQQRPDPEPGRFEVVVAPTFAGLNPADVLQREGRHPVPAGWPGDIPGLEVAGAVVAIGDAVTAHRLGDRVFGLLGGGGLAQRVLVNEREVVSVPDELDDEQAAAVPEAFVAAFDAVCCQAGLASGDTLLVNGAAGAVGSAAVQLGVALGARVVAGVRDDAARARVAGLGAEALSVDAARERVRELGGADIVFEVVGALVGHDLEVLAPQGRLVVFAGKPHDAVTIGLRQLMAIRGRLLGTSLRGRPSEQKATLMQSFAKRVVPLLARGTVRPIVDRHFALEDVDAAFEALQQPGRFGKLLLAVGS